MESRTFSWLLLASRAENVGNLFREVPGFISYLQQYHHDFAILALLAAAYAYHESFALLTHPALLVHWRVLFFAAFAAKPIQLALTEYSISSTQGSSAIVATSLRPFRCLTGYLSGGSHTQLAVSWLTCHVGKFKCGGLDLCSAPLQTYLYRTYAGHCVRRLSKTLHQISRR